MDLQRNPSNPGMDIISNSTASIDTLDYIDDILRDLTSYKRAFINRGINMIDFIKTKARIHSFHSNEPGTLDVVEQLEGQLSKIIDVKPEFTDHWMTNPHKDNGVHLKQLRQFSDVQTTKDLSNEGLTSVERFIREYETTLDEYNKTTEAVNKPFEGRSKKNNIALKGEINNVEEASHNFKYFLQTCKIFKGKLDEYKNTNMSPASNESLATLISQIDDVMNLSKKVRDMGATSTSMEKFIKNCEDFKKCLQRRRDEQNKAKSAKKVASELVCHFCTDENVADNLSDAMCNLCCSLKEPPNQKLENKPKHRLEEDCDRCFSQHVSGESKHADGEFNTIRTITKVTRYLNTDGTIQEEREVLKIKQVRSDGYDNSRRKNCTHKKSKKDRHKGSNDCVCKGIIIKEKHDRNDQCGEGVHKNPYKSILVSTPEPVKSAGIQNKPETGICDHSRPIDKSSIPPLKLASQGEQLCSKHKNVMAPKTLRKIYMSKSKGNVVCDCVSPKDETCEICAAEKIGLTYLSNVANICSCSDIAINQNDKKASEDIPDVFSAKSVSKCKSESSPALSVHTEEDTVWLRLCEQCCAENRRAKKSGIVAKVISCNFSQPSDSCSTFCRSLAPTASSISSQFVSKSDSETSCDLCSQGDKHSHTPNSVSRSTSKSVSKASCDHSKCLHSNTSSIKKPDLKLNELCSKRDKVKLKAPTASSISSQFVSKSDSETSCDLCSQGDKHSHTPNSVSRSTSKSVSKASCDHSKCLHSNTSSIKKPDSKLNELCSIRDKVKLKASKESCCCELCSEPAKQNQNDYACTDKKGDGVNKVLCDQCLTKLVLNKIEELLKTGKLPKCAQYSDPRICQCCVSLSENNDTAPQDSETCDLCFSTHPSSHRSIQLPPEVDKPHVIKPKEQKDPEIIYCPKSAVALNIVSDTDGETCMCEEKDEQNVCKSCTTEIKEKQCTCPLSMPTEVHPDPVLRIESKVKPLIQIDEWECDERCSCPSEASEYVEHEQYKRSTIIEQVPIEIPSATETRSYKSLGEEMPVDKPHVIKPKEPNDPEIIYCPKSAVALNIVPDTNGEICMCEEKDEQNVCKSCTTEIKEKQCTCPLSMPSEVHPEPVLRIESKVKRLTQIIECECVERYACPSEASENLEPERYKRLLIDEVPIEIPSPTETKSLAEEITVDKPHVIKPKGAKDPEIIYCPKSAVALNIVSDTDGEICMCKEKDEKNVCKSCTTKLKDKICTCPLLLPTEVQTELAFRIAPKVKPVRQIDNKDEYECDERYACPSEASKNVEPEKYKRSIIIEQVPIEIPSATETRSYRSTAEEMNGSRSCSQAPSMEGCGLYETKVRVITRVSRYLKPDGTIQETREVITIKHEKHDPCINQIDYVTDKDYWEDNSAYEIVNDTLRDEKN